MVKIETLHAPDRGTQTNVHNLGPEQLKRRDIVNIDIADDVPSRDYKPDDDPKKFVSERTGRGPLVIQNWRQECEPVMCCYKLVTVEFKWYGMQTRVEKFIMKQEAKLFTNFHRQLFCWIDRWHGLTLQDIRALEAETKRKLDEQRRLGPLQGSRPDDN